MLADVSQKGYNGDYHHSTTFCNYEVSVTYKSGWVGNHGFSFIQQELEVRSYVFLNSGMLANVSQKGYNGDYHHSTTFCNYEVSVTYKSGWVGNHRFSFIQQELEVRLYVFLNSGMLANVSFRG